MGSFELASLSWLFAEMWDSTRQLVSTEANLLAACMLADKHLGHSVAKLQLCWEDINWLCTWVPEFGARLHRVENDEEMLNRMMYGAEMEESALASYISSWERLRRRCNCCSFEDSTPLSSMLLTHGMPVHAPLFCDLTRTMQIFSVRVTELEGFEWPLEVYGVAAARDVVDYRRNIPFLRTREDCQFLTEQDSFLRLTGPSRAIMSRDDVWIEIQLKVKGRTKSEDIALITKAFSCKGCDGDGFFTRSIHGCFCRIDVCCEHLRESIQATILSVCVIEGSLPSENGVQVVCTSLPEEDAECEAERTSKHVVLLARKDGTVPVDEDGYLDLSRQVVPVKLKGMLEILITTFAQSGDISDCVVFTPEFNSISQKSCVLGECELEITVAWSLLVDDEQNILMMGYTKPYIAPSSLPFMELVDTVHWYT